MSDGARHSIGRRAEDQIRLDEVMAENEVLKARIKDLEIDLALQFTLRDKDQDALAAYRRASADKLSFEFE